MTRAAIYARYSSDKQSERSAEDQARLCQERADREGWDVVGVFADLAISGETRNRPGLNALLAAIDDIDVVLAEHTDRISRDQEDIAAIYKRIRYADAQIVTISQGEIGLIHIGLSGTMAALFLKELGDKTRRGQIGRVAMGRIPGGLSYGYTAVPAFDSRGRPDRGLRQINQEEAAVVRRIFAEFLEGLGPKQIAEGLNRDRIPAPSGGKWGASTIRGNRRRGTGILHNELYVGRIVYNRQRFEKHPDTRKRLSRPNPPEEWRTADVPELTIVDQRTWNAVAAHFDKMTGVPASKQRRPKRLFSEMVRCGECWSGYTIVAGSTWGCSGRREGRGCTNAATISNNELERRVLDALRDRMLAPDIVAAFIAEYQRAMEEGRRHRLSGLNALRKRHARADGQIKRMVDAIADGRATVDDVHEKIRSLDDERKALSIEIADLEAEKEVAILPGIADVYRQKLQALAKAVRVEDPGTGEARSIIRGLLDGIIATPRKGERGVNLDLQGRLAAILALGTNENRLPEEAASVVSRMTPTLEMVAGTGFEPVTFRL